MNEPTPPQAPQTTPTAPAPNAPAHTSTTPTGTPQVALHTWGTLTPTEAAKMIEWERDNLAKGKITPEEAAKRFDALGATPDTRSDEVKLVDAHFPAAKPEEFLIRYGTDAVMTPALKAFDHSAPRG